MRLEFSDFVEGDLEAIADYIGWITLRGPSASSARCVSGSVRLERIP